MSAIWRRTQICRDLSFRKERPGAARRPAVSGQLPAEPGCSRLPSGAISIVREPSSKPKAAARMRLRLSALLAFALVFLAAASRPMRRRRCRRATAFPSSRPFRAARPSARKALKTTYEAKYRKVYKLLKNDKKLRSKIREAAGAYGIDPMHIVGAIVGEHTYNVDAYDRLQTYYVKAVSYLDSAIAFSYDGERHRRFHPAAGICRLQRRQGQLRSVDLPRSRVGHELPRQEDGFPNDRFSADVLPALLCRPDIRHRPAQSADGAGDERPGPPRLRPADARQQRSARRLQDHHGSGPDAALCRGDAEEVDRRLQVDRRLRHLAESRPDRDALQSRQPGSARPRAEGRERQAARSRGSSPGCRKKTTMAGWSTRSCRSCRRCSSRPHASALDRASSIAVKAAISSSSSMAMRAASRLASAVALADSPAVSITTRGSDVSASRCNSSASSQITLK